MEGILNQKRLWYRQELTFSRAGCLPPSPPPGHYKREFPALWHVLDVYVCGECLSVLGHKRGFTWLGALVGHGNLVSSLSCVHFALRPLSLLFPPLGPRIRAPSTLVSSLSHASTRAHPAPPPQKSSHESGGGAPPRGRGFCRSFAARMGGDGRTGLPAICALAPRCCEPVGTEETRWRCERCGES